MIFGLILNLLGMVGEFLSPWFIGRVIDEITAANYDEVTRLTIVWMIFNSVSDQILIILLIGRIIL
jgi:hypothetical protein